MKMIANICFGTENGKNAIHEPMVKFLIRKRYKLRKSA